MSIRLTKIFIGIILVTASLLVVSAKSAFAADPQFMVSWKTNSIVPSWYEGKSFPTKGSRVTVSFELISQNSADFGKLVDVSGSQVKWYLNGRFYTQQTGLKSLTFTNNLFPGSSINIGISVEVTNPSDGTTIFMDKSASIPVISPEMIINNNIFDKTISSNSTLNLTAAPFFFNVVSLNNVSAVWDVAGQQSDKNSDNPFSLALKLGQNVPSGPLDINITAQNIYNALENAVSSIEFIVR